LKPEAPVATSCSNLDESTDYLGEMLLPDLARDIEEQSVFNTTSIHAAPELVRSDLIQSTRTCEPNSHSSYATWPLFTRRPCDLKTLSALQKDLYHLVKIGEEDATACREAPIFDKYKDLDDDPEPSTGSHLGLTITSTPEGRFMYWNGLETVTP
jgi:hypothetical protein